MSQAEIQTNNNATFLRFNTQNLIGDYNSDLVTEQTDNISPKAGALYVDKQALQQYRQLCREIAELEAEKEATAYGQIGSSWQAGPRVSGGSRADATPECAQQLWRLSNLIANRLNQLVTLRAAIEQAISSLLPEERRLLRLFYIQGRPAAECAGLLQYSERHFWRRHQRTLQKLAEAQGVRQEIQPWFTNSVQPAV